MGTMGCHSKTMKRRSRRRNKKSPVSTIASLPNELATEVVARVAAASSTDYLNVKLSCKGLNQLGEDKYIFQRVSLEQFPVIPWHTKKHKHVVSFLNKCKESGNPEALYRQGVVDYFSKLEAETGLECLKRATKLGHVEASYVLGMLLTCSGEECKQRQGMDILNKMMFLKVTGACREKFKAVRNLMWLMNKPNLDQTPSICKRHQLTTNGKGWHSIDSEDVEELPCQDCRYDREVFIFCNLLC